MPGVVHQLIPDYHAHPAYVYALEQQIRDFWKGAGTPQNVLFSFHGIPARFDARGDPYAQQCARTAKLLAAALNLDESQWRMGYQSRFGPEPWLRPYADEVLMELGKQGVRSLHVVAPGFSVDCLETLEEIEQEGGDLFRQAGGEDYRYIPALNAGGFHIEALSAILDEWVGLT
jgi:ferrochelatase